MPIAPNSSPMVNAESRTWKAGASENLQPGSVTEVVMTNGGLPRTRAHDTGCCADPAAGCQHVNDNGLLCHVSQQQLLADTMLLPGQ